MKEAEGLLYLLDLVAIVALNVSLHFHNLQPENKDFKLKITSKNGFIKYLFTWYSVWASSANPVEMAIWWFVILIPVCLYLLSTKQLFNFIFSSQTFPCCIFCKNTTTRCSALFLTKSGRRCGLPKLASSRTWAVSMCRTPSVGPRRGGRYSSPLAWRMDELTELALLHTNLAWPHQSHQRDISLVLTSEIIAKCFNSLIKITSKMSILK